jgi:type II secretory pathway predicted ATPase ExeA
MILVGQPELRDLMRTPQLAQLAQRIGADYHIGGLNREETARYVAHRLKVAGGRTDIFDHESLSLVHVSSRGIPRLINQLCDTAMVYAFAAQQQFVIGELMQEVIKDRMAGGIFPGRRTRTSELRDKPSGGI